MRKKRKKRKEGKRDKGSKNKEIKNKNQRKCMSVRIYYIFRSKKLIIF